MEAAYENRTRISTMARSYNNHYTKAAYTGWQPFWDLFSFTSKH